MVKTDIKNASRHLGGMRFWNRRYSAGMRGSVTVKTVPVLSPGAAETVPP